MAKVKIELDISVIEEAIKLKAAPQVADLLARHYDIPNMIVEELVRAPSKTERKYPNVLLHGLSYFGETGVVSSGPEYITALVRNAIRAAAREYVDVAVDERREAIYAAFRRMMKDSPDRLVNAFVEMIEGADIELDLTTTLAVKEPERSYGD